MAKQNFEKLAIEKQAADFFDWSTFLLTALLVAFGLISIYSATYDSGMSLFFNKQLTYTAIGTATMFALMFVPER